MHTDFAFICLEFTWVAFVFFCFFRFLLTYIQSNHIFAACCYRNFIAYNFIIYLFSLSAIATPKIYAVRCLHMLFVVIFCLHFYATHCCKLYFLLSFTSCRCIVASYIVCHVYLFCPQRYWSGNWLNWLLPPQLVGIACAGIVCAGHPTATSGREFDSLYVCACVVTVMSVN